MEGWSEVVLIGPDAATWFVVQGELGKVGSPQCSKLLSRPVS